MKSKPNVKPSIDLTYSTAVPLFPFGCLQFPSSHSLLDPTLSASLKMYLSRLPLMSILQSPFSNSESSSCWTLITPSFQTLFLSSHFPGFIPRSPGSFLLTPLTSGCRTVLRLDAQTSSPCSLNS